MAHFTQEHVQDQLAKAPQTKVAPYMRASVCNIRLELAEGDTAWNPNYDQENPGLTPEVFTGPTTVRYAQWADGDTTARVTSTAV